LAGDGTRELREQLGAELRRLRRARGLSQDDLATAAGYSGSRAAISRVETGRGLLPDGMVAPADRVLGADGALVRLQREAWAAEQHSRVDERVPGVGAAGAGQDEPAGPPAQGTDAGGMVDATDRRQVLQTAGSLTAAEVVAVLAQRVATADPTPLDLGNIEAAVMRAAEDYQVLPDRFELRTRLEQEHLGVEALLDRRLSMTVRDQLTVHAGRYCYYLAWLTFNIGDDRAARVYSTMARHHAAEAPDPLLVGSVAELRSGLAEFAGAHEVAADIAAQARKDPAAHPYARPALAAFEARAAAQLRQPDRARAALADMEVDLWSGPLLPGPDLFGEEAAQAWLAIVLGRLGEGEAAEGHARASLTMLAATGEPFLIAGTCTALATAFLHRRRPEPEQAAAAAAQALRTGPSRAITDKATRTWRDLNARWGDLPAVRDLGEMVAAARRALPAAV